MGSSISESFTFTGRSSNFPCRSVAADYRMIDSPMLPVIIPREGQAQEVIARLGKEQISSGTLARDLQAFTVQIPARARELLRQNGKGGFHRSDLRGDQFFVLEDLSLYSEDSGLIWEDAEFLAADQSFI